MKEESQNCPEKVLKAMLRKEAEKTRFNIPLERRKEAEKKLLLLLQERLQFSTHVLSFVPFRSEIDINPVNAFLLDKKALCLPHAPSFSLCFIESQKFLAPSKIGLFEPNIRLCPHLDPSELSAILVPGLLFDKEGFRIGYGGGFYDRLLAKISSHTDVLGIGFMEQKSTMLLPREPHDLPVKELLLV